MSYTQIPLSLANFAYTVFITQHPKIKVDEQTTLLSSKDLFQYGYKVTKNALDYAEVNQAQVENLLQEWKYFLMCDLCKYGLPATIIDPVIRVPVAKKLYSFDTETLSTLELLRYPIDGAATDNIVPTYYAFPALSSNKHTLVLPAKVDGRVTTFQVTGKRGERLVNLYLNYVTKYMDQLQRLQEFIETFEFTAETVDAFWQQMYGEGPLVKRVKL